MMEDYQERVVVEKDELQARLAKLEGFLEDSVSVTSVDLAEYGRLMIQRDLMRALLRVLKSRVRNFETEKAS